MATVPIQSLLQSSLTVSGYSGYSGAGVSGYSGFSGAGVSGYSGFSGAGTSGYSGFSGAGGTATSLNSTDDNSTATNVYPVWVATTGSTSTIKSSTARLYFVPSTGILNSTGFNSLSDKNAKRNIETIQNALSSVLQLRGVSYEFVDSKKPSIGLVAQELETVIPEVVETNNNGEKTVNYGALVGLLIEAIKELNDKIEKLEGK